MCTQLGFDLVVLLFLWKLNKKSKSVSGTAMAIGLIPTQSETPH